jgi:hypothetical protein
MPGPYGTAGRLLCLGDEGPESRAAGEVLVFTVEHAVDHADRVLDRGQPFPELGTMGLQHGGPLFGVGGIDDLSQLGQAQRSGLAAQDRRDAIGVVVGVAAPTGVSGGRQQPFSLPVPEHVRRYADLGSKITDATSDRS